MLGLGCTGDGGAEVPNKGWWGIQRSNRRRKRLLTALRSDGQREEVVLSQPGARISQGRLEPQGVWQIAVGAAVETCLPWRSCQRQRGRGMNTLASSFFPWFTGDWLKEQKWNMAVIQRLYPQKAGRDGRQAEEVEVSGLEYQRRGPMEASEKGAFPSSFWDLMIGEQALLSWCSDSWEGLPFTKTNMDTAFTESLTCQQQGPLLWGRR